MVSSVSLSDICPVNVSFKITQCLNLVDLILFCFNAVLQYAIMHQSNRLIQLTGNVLNGIYSTLQVLIVMCLD